MLKVSRAPVVAAASPLSGLLRHALACCEAQQWAQAELSCEQILKLAPDQVDALHIMGLAALQTGRNERAADLLGRAIAGIAAPPAILYLRLGVALQNMARLPEAIAAYQQAARQQPELAEVHNNMGQALRALGQLDNALACFRTAAALLPGAAIIPFNMGETLQALGRFDEAMECYRQALALQPGMVAAWINVADIFSLAGKVEDAVVAYRQALAVQAHSAAAFFGLGKVLAQQGRADEAMECYSEGLRYQAGNAEAWTQLATLLRRKGRLQEAEVSCHRAATAQPDYVPAHECLADILKDMRRFADAEACYRHILSLQPDSALTHSSLGFVLLQQGRLAEAAACQRQALALDGNLAAVHYRLALVLMEQGEVAESLASYQRALALQPGNAVYYSAMLMTLQYSPQHSAAEVFAAHRQYNVAINALPRSAWPVHGNEQSPERRLRVGYVSADLRMHAVAQFLEPILAAHDRAAVEIFAYYNFHLADEVTGRLQALTEHWLVCDKMSDAELAQRIRDDGIDILIDLSGHSAANRLPVFARKPAPVQMTWMGYPGTTGLEAMDYRLTDTNLDPVGEAEAFHSETLIRLPHSATFRQIADCPPVNDLPALSAGQVTLACLNNLIKLNPVVVALWARILADLPGTTLMLGNAGRPEVAARLLAMFANAGVGSERLVLLPTMPLPEFLALHHRIDLALDPFPYGGGTTTMHSCWMGVPVVTLAGASTTSRHGAAIMNGMGLPEFVTRTEEEYRQRVSELAGDLPRLQEIRRGLRQRMNTTAQSAPLTRALEQEYRQAWRTWCASQS